MRLGLSGVEEVEGDRLIEQVLGAVRDPSGRVEPHLVASDGVRRRADQGHLWDVIVNVHESYQDLSPIFIPPVKRSIENFELFPVVRTSPSDSIDNLDSPIGNADVLSIVRCAVGQRALNLECSRNRQGPRLVSK